MISKRTLLIACITVLNVKEIMAQNELDPVTITASIQPISASATGRNIIIIKGEQFANLPVNSVDELLRYVPGIEVQMRGPMGSQSDIVMRGGTFQQVLVIIDGIRINDPNTGHFNSYTPIAPSEISRIEILKGASSAIYGSEAVGGVIHIITKSFASKKGQESKQANAQLSLGEYDLKNAQLGGFFSKGNTAISGGVLTNNTSGQPQRGTSGFVYNTTASLSLKHHLNDQLSVAYRSAFDKRDFAAQNFYTTFASDTAKEKVTSFWNHLRLAYAAQKHSITFDAGYKTVNDEFKFSPVSTANSNKSRLLQSLLVYTQKLSEKTSFSTGSQYVNKKIASNDRGNHEVDNAGLFFVLNQLIGQQLHFSPAVRFDWNERSGWEVVPQVNASYKLQKFVFRGSAGQTTRDADFTERFNNYNKTFVANGSLGNPDLQPERSFSYEIGSDYIGLKNIRIAATLFKRHHSDLIDYVITPYADLPRKSNLSPTGRYALAKNIGTVKTRGAELDLQFTQPLENKKQLLTNIGITVLKSESDAGTPSFYLSSHAKLLVNGSVQYTVKWFSISANAVYKERQEQAATAINASISKNYFVANIKSQAMILKNKVGVFVQLDNIFDKKYSDLLGSVMPGRWLMGGIKATL